MNSFPDISTFDKIQNFKIQKQKKLKKYGYLVLGISLDKLKFPNYIESIKFILFREFFDQMHYPLSKFIKTIHIIVLYPEGHL